MGSNVMSDNIRKQFDEELHRLRSMVAAMGRLTIEQIDTVLQAADRADAALASRVIEREPEADRMEHQIDTLVVRILALRQPMAVDLRQALSSLRIANELERICDHAENLAERVTAVENAGNTWLRSLINLGRFANTMVVDAMRAYEQTDVAQAEAVWNRDKELDEMYTKFFRELLTHMAEDPRRIGASTQMLFMARDIERIGDRATNIAEMVSYLVIGEPVEEERPKADATASTIPAS
jgi:phosphate transport system protein